jgi:flagellar motility protein MotE (MotC chaperone)
MKSVLIISALTFTLIFGGVVLLSTQLKQPAAAAAAGPELTAVDYEGAERVFRDIAIERDRIQQERESLATLRQSTAAQQLILTQEREQLLEVIRQLEVRQQTYTEEREVSAAKLAKMYEAMKPAQAAPILSALELDIILDIMSRMKERPAAKILANMEAGLAAQVSTRMSLRGGS